jgi:nucleoside-diphosphate-sugar epimerase
MAMRIFIAGASGAVGRRLIPMLIQSGHQVTGTTSRTENVDGVARLGAEPVVVNALDPEPVLTAVNQARPDIVISELSALSGPQDLRHFDATFATTNRLRTEGTEYLLSAARAAGAKQFLAQSFTGWPNERRGGSAKTETDPLDPEPTPPSRQTLAAIRRMESIVDSAVDMAAVSLRYGTLYGPGTGFAPGGDVVDMVRKRRLPIVGQGTGVWSFVHIDDAASATVAAIEDQASGVYNIVDDEPAPVSQWLPYLAEIIGAKPPLRLPGWLVRPLLGEHGIALMTSIRGSSNAKARRDLRWEPRYPSWRQGFRAALG